MSSLEILLCLGCGASSVKEEPGCADGGEATFELGTGETEFLELQPGQDFSMVRGPQGGCHFPLAFLTRGYPGDRTLVRYEVYDVTEAREVIRSRQFVKLAESPARPGWCESLNFVAFLVDPWTLEEDRLRVSVTIEEGTVTSSQSVEIIAKWPDPVEGVARELFCGER